MLGKNQMCCAINPLGIAVVISLIGVNGNIEPILAQTYSPMEEDVTLTGNSLQGLDSSSLAENQSNTPQWDVTIEREKQKPSFSTGNKFFDSLLEKQSQPKTAPREANFNSNQGDVPVNQSGTIPLFSF